MTAVTAKLRRPDADSNGLVNELLARESSLFAPSGPRADPTTVVRITGGLMVTGTSSAQPNQIWGKPYVYELETSGTPSAWTGVELTPQTTEEDTRAAISELRRLSGLTWDQLAGVFRVSRRSLHFWASGKPLTAENEELLMQFLGVVREANRGDAARTRAALLDSRGGTSAFALIKGHDFDAARDHLGPGPGSSRPTLRELSPAAKEARTPLPPETLAAAEDERVHVDVGRSRPARTSRTKRSGDR